MSYRSRVTAHPEGYTGLAQPEPSLPARWYLDPAQFARELARIWYRQWLYVCRADALPEPGCFRTFEIGDQNVLLVRDRHGEVRAYHNACRHRGSRLVKEPEGRLRALALTCPYHAWLYNLSGKLLKTPNVLDDGGFDRSQYGLFPVSLQLWRGSLFLCLAEDPPPFEATFGGDEHVYDNWPLEELVVGHSETFRIASNWKLFWETYNECYHCPGVHPELVKLVPIYGRGIMGRQDDPDWQTHANDQTALHRGGVREGADSWASDGCSQGPGFPKLSEEERRRGMTFVTLLPSAFMIAHSDYMRIVRLRPIGPAETELQAEWLFPSETLATPGFDLDKIVGFARLVMEQDARACELNQAGLSALPFEAGVLLPQEYSVKDFQDWVRRQLAE